VNEQLVRPPPGEQRDERPLAPAGCGDFSLEGGKAVAGPASRRSYYPGISVRIASLLSVILMAAAAYFVVTNRSRIEAQIHRRQTGFATCARSGAGHDLAASRDASCGWAQLSESRRGDLFGLPFIALALGLFLVLTYKIGHPRPENPLKMADTRGEDPMP